MPSGSSKTRTCPQYHGSCEHCRHETTPPPAHTRLESPVVAMLQGVCHMRAGREPFRRIVFHASLHHLSERSVTRHAVPIHAPARMPSRQCGVHGCSQRIDIHSWISGTTRSGTSAIAFGGSTIHDAIHCAICDAIRNIVRSELLRSAEAWRASPPFRGPRAFMGDSEIYETHLAFRRNHDVARFDIPMHHRRLSAMQVFEHIA